MRIIMNLLANIAALYSLLILIRVMLTWFSGARYGKPVELLSKVTDPYLDWWRDTLRLRAGFLDLSPIAAMAALSLAQSIFSTIARYGRISLGIILAIVLSALWSALSFILGFCLIILVLRLIAFMTNRDIYGVFWRIIDTISQPLLYRINRIIFGKRLVNYLTGIIAAIAVLAAIWIGGRFAVRLLAGLLLRLPV
ncbi:MAG: YggT family protein [Treponema sp.]|nr:YggT family protein [Treponema sp.]